jgi:hypothetical protein
MKSFRGMLFATAALMFLLLTAGSARSATTISIAQGWNLISLPLQQPVNTPVASVLSGVSGAYEVVWAYSNGAWKVYDPNDAAGSTLKTMQAGNGYWIKMLSAKKLSVSGSTPSSSIPLVSGWNLVGYNAPSCAAVSASSAGLSALGANLQVLWGYPSQGWQSYPSGGLTQLCPGAGYWIDVSGTATWTVGSVSGTAAQGSAIPSATVTLVDKNGNTAGGTTGSDGSFNISGTADLAPPFMLQVQTSPTNNLYSVSADPNASTTINVTPLTDMIVRSWYAVQGKTVDSAFANPAKNPPPTPTDVKIISSVVLAIVQGWLQAAGVDTNDFNLISTPFAANGTGVDGVLDLTSVTVDSSNISVGIANGDDSITQSSTVTPSNGSVSVSTTQTTSSGTTSPVTTSTVVPTTPTQATALAGINTTITNFVNTVNQKGSSLTGSDLAPYVDPNYLDNGENASQWETSVASFLVGASLTYTGLQINSLDTTDTPNIADVTFQLTITKGASGTVKPLEMNFKPINNVWVITGNGQIADAYVETWAWYQPSGPTFSYAYTNTLRLEVDDPLQNNVKSVTVSGLGVPYGSSTVGTATVPLICSYNPADCNGGQCPLCENSHGSSGTVKSFDLDISGYWPPISTIYTFTLTTAIGAQKTYYSTVTSEFGFDTSQTPPVPVPADYPSMTFTGGSPTLSDILSGGTFTGSIYVPVWDNNLDPPHFNWEGPNGNSNNVSNIDVDASWTSGLVVPGQMNNFTITIPPATIDSSPICPGGSGVCPIITFNDQQGNPQTGQIQGGWFGMDACYGNVAVASMPVACTTSGVEVTQ